MPDIKVVELFAGIGGFRIGLEAASNRYNIIWAEQWEPNKSELHAFDCYVNRFGDSIYHVSHVICNLSAGRIFTLSPLKCELNGFPDNRTAAGMPEEMRYSSVDIAFVVPIVTRNGISLEKHKETLTFV